MKTQRQPLTNEKLIELRNKEIEQNGSTYTDRRKTIEEMLRMRGVKF